MLEGIFFIVLGSIRITLFCRTEYEIFVLNYQLQCTNLQTFAFFRGYILIKDIFTTVLLTYSNG